MLIKRDKCFSEFLVHTHLKFLQDIMDLKVYLKTQQVVRVNSIFLNKFNSSRENPLSMIGCHLFVFCFPSNS